MAKYVVAVCADLVKHSEAWRRIPREPMVAVMGEYKHIAEKLASDFGYLHLNFTGDGHFFLFENADAAVRFGLKLVSQWHSAFEELPALQAHQPLPLRIGAHFGDETELDNGDTWVGRCGNLAKRIEGEADPDSVYVSEGLLDLIDLPLYAVQAIGSRTLTGDHIESRSLHRVDSFDDEAFSRKPPRELGPSDWFLKGVAMIGTPEEDSDTEAECYAEALRLRSDYPEAHNNYAVLLHRSGDPEQAEHHYRETLRVRPDYPEAHNNYASFLTDRGDLEQADDHLKEALRLRPDYAEAHNNYAKLLMDTGHPEQAYEHLKEALRLRPDDPNIHNNYGVLLRNRGDLEQADEHYKEALRLHPDDPEIHNNYAVLLWTRGDEQAAEDHYREALRLRPHYGSAHYNYARLLAAQGHPRKAKKHFGEAYRLEPDHPAIRSAFETQAWRTLPSGES